MDIIDVIREQEADDAFLLREEMRDMHPTTSGIYKITCTVTKKIYIGSAVNLYARQHVHFSVLRQNKHENPYLQRAFNKYGPDAFTFEVLELVLPISLTAREQYWLNKLKPFGKCGFNLAPIAGSHLGRKNTPQTIEKLRQAKAGTRPSPQAFEAARQANLGRKHTPERIEKRRQAATGKKHTPEAIEKMRQAKLGKKHSEQSRRNMAESHKGKKRSPETRENISQALKRFHQQKG